MEISWVDFFGLVVGIGCCCPKLVWFATILLLSNLHIFKPSNHPVKYQPQYTNTEITVFVGNINVF